MAVGMQSGRRWRVGAAAAVLVAAGAASAQAQSSACVEPRKEEIAAITSQWQAAIAAGNADAIAAHYAHDAVLMPAMSQDVLTGQAAIRAYFAEFAGRHPVPVATSSTIMTGCGMASDVGTMNYRVTGQRKGTRMLVGGRSSTVFVARDGRWLIAQQSLALLPQAYRSGGR
jgi:uncharacterized protein (TIGR02246 family)